MRLRRTTKVSTNGIHLYDSICLQTNHALLLDQKNRYPESLQRWSRWLNRIPESSCRVSKLRLELILLLFQWLILKVKKSVGRSRALPEILRLSLILSMCQSVYQSFQKRNPSCLAEYSTFGGYLARKMQKTLLKSCRRPRSYLAPTIIMSK